MGRKMRLTSFPLRALSVAAETVAVKFEPTTRIVQADLEPAISTNERTELCSGQVLVWATTHDGKHTIRNLALRYVGSERGLWRFGTEEIHILGNKGEIAESFSVEETDDGKLKVTKKT